MEKRGFLSITRTNEGDRTTALHGLDDPPKTKRPASDALSEGLSWSSLRCVSPKIVGSPDRASLQRMKSGAMSNDKNIAGTCEVSPAIGYAGDVTPAVAWKILSERRESVLIDVRTRAEWNFVGLPDLVTLDKKPALVEWQVFPSMQPNPEFVAALSGALTDKSAPLLFLCRSGARSAAAAKAMTAAGYSTCLNVADGFEGPLDAQAKRGAAGGWKATGLPWRQT